MASHLLAIQEDDWGTLRLLEIDSLTGSISEHRNMPYSDIFTDDSNYIIKGSSTIAVSDGNRRFAFYTLDGEHLMDFADVASDSSAIEKNIFDSAGFAVGNTFNLYVKEDNTLVKRHSVNPLTGDVTVTTLFDWTLISEELIDLYPSDVLLLECLDGVHLYTRNSTPGGSTYTEWHMTSLNNWSPIRSYAKPGFQEINFDRRSILQDSENLELIQQRPTNRNLSKFVINRETGLITLVPVAVDVYPDVIPSIESHGCMVRLSTSTSLSFAYGAVADADNTTPTQFDTQVLPTLGAAGSGPNGVGKSWIFGPTTAVNHNGVSGDAYGGTYAGYVIELKFASVSGESIILEGEGGKLVIDNGHIVIKKPNGTVMASHSQVLTTGVWYKIWVANYVNHDKPSPILNPNYNASPYLRIAVDNNLEETEIALPFNFPIKQFGTSQQNLAFYSIPSMSAEVGGFYFSNTYNNVWSFLSELYTRIPTVPTGEINYASTPPANRGYVQNRMGAIRGQYTEPYFFDGTAVPTITGNLSYNMPSGEVYTLDPSQVYDLSYIKVGTFTVLITSYYIRVINAAGATVSEYFAQSTSDREWDDQECVTMFTNLQENFITGNVSNSGTGGVNGVKLRLLNADSSQILTEQTTNGTYSFKCFTTTPKSVLAIHPNPAKGHLVKSGLIPE